MRFRSISSTCRLLLTKTIFFLVRYIVVVLILNSIFLNIVFSKTIHFLKVYLKIDESLKIVLEIWFLQKSTLDKYKNTKT